LAGFRVLCGVDLERKYISSFKRNFPEAEALTLDVTETSGEELLDQLGLAPGQLDLLAGGPPCQGFSKNVPRSKRRSDLDNNRLVSTFLDYCESILPRTILMENVAEMKNGYGQQYTDEIVEKLEAAGYAVQYAVLTAADYGVPQRRRRAFFLATRDGVDVTIPPPTHRSPKKEDLLFEEKAHVTVWEAIGDLPSLQHGQSQEPLNYAQPPQNEFQAWTRQGATATMNHVARHLKPLQYERLASLEPGQGLKDLPDHLKVKGGYSGAYGRLTKEMVCATITRWVFHPGSGRWGHPVDTRVLTIREAARMQSFPDTFEFVGSYNEQAGQIGNAVPPLLALRLAEKIRDGLANRGYNLTCRVKQSGGPVMALVKEF